MFLPHIDAPEAAATEHGLDIKVLSYLGAVATHVDPQRVQQALDFLRNIISDFGVGFAVHLDVTSLPSIEPILSLLDAGTATAFVSIDQLRQLAEVKTVGLDRLVMKVPWAEREAAKAQVRANDDGSVRVLAEGVPDLESLQSWLAERGDSASSIYVSMRGKEHLDGNSVSELVRRFAVIPVIPASALTVDEKAHPELLPLRSLLALSSDRPDGLYPTVVTDEHGIALGLVYSSAESLQESLRTGRGVYHSRKRGLWYKGESSGDVQELVRIHVDCDHDCLRYTVRQKGKGIFLINPSHYFVPRIALG
jgi:phosphoribosyl-ATP pyrophosphohydrolase/phosphoribosyl-AMP cyclohydrolase/histidinol dehydrogenase